MEPEIVTLPLPGGLALNLRRLDDAAGMRLWRAYWLNTCEPTPAGAIALWNGLAEAVVFEGDPLLPVVGYDVHRAAQLRAERAARPADLQLSDAALWLALLLRDNTSWLRALALATNLPACTVYALGGGRPAVDTLAA